MSAQAMMRQFNPFTNALLARRAPEFYLGKVLLLNEQTKPEGWPTGYYRLAEISEGNMWHFEYLSDTEPDEPVYKYEYYGQVDLWAVPRTVWDKSIRNSFLIWGAIWLAGVIWWAGINGENAVAIILIWGTIMLTPCMKWGLRIEPVTTMKIMYLIMVILALLAYRRHKDNNSAQRDQNNRLLA